MFIICLVGPQIRCFEVVTYPICSLGFGDWKPDLMKLILLLSDFSWSRLLQEVGWMFRPRDPGPQAHRSYLSPRVSEDSSRLFGCFSSTDFGVAFLFFASSPPRHILASDGAAGAPQAQVDLAGSRCRAWRGCRVSGPCYAATLA